MPLRSRQIAFFSIGLFVLALGPIAQMFVVRSSMTLNPVPLPHFGDCASLHGWAGGWSTVFVEPDYSISDSYQCDGYRLHVNLVQYAEQHQGKEAVGQFNSIIPRAWWNMATRGRERVTPNLEVDEYRVERMPMRLTIWNWYAVDAQPTSSELATKAMEAFHALRLRSTVTSNITIAVEAEPDFDAAKVLKADAMIMWTWFQTQMSASA